jgi:hypothetical protein
MFHYATSRRIVRTLCDKCEAASPDTDGQRKLSPPEVTEEDFILAWEMSDTMDDLLALLPEYNDPSENGKGRGRARSRAFGLRQRGKSLKMMAKG